MALLTMDCIGSRFSSPPDAVLVQAIADDQTLKVVQVKYRNTGPADVVLDVSAPSGFKLGNGPQTIRAGTPDTTINIPGGQQPNITLGGPYGFRIPGWSISLEG